MLVAVDIGDGADDVFEGCVLVCHGGILYAYRLSMWIVLVC